MFSEMEHEIDTLCRRAGDLTARGITGWEAGALSYRKGRHMIITSGSISPAGFSSGDVSVVDLRDLSVSGNQYPAPYYRAHAALYSYDEKINSIIHCCSTAVMTSSMAGREVYPMLDDMAMIVGPSAKVIDCGEEMNGSDMRKLHRAIKHRSAVLLCGHGALCAGTDIDDAIAVSLVLEKGCRCFIETNFIGGGVRLSPSIARKMRKFYLSSYSKAAQNNR